MEAEHRHAACAGVGDLAEQTVEMLDRVGEFGQHRRNHDMTVKAGFADRGDQAESRLWRRRSRLDFLVQQRVSHRERDSDADLDAGGCIRDERKIAAQQGALGEDGERRAGVGQCAR